MAVVTMAAVQNKAIVYQDISGNDVKLSPAIIKKYLVSGDASKVSDQEVTMFLNLCRYQKLNPFLREAYLIKYGNSPATMVTGKETFTKRAQRDPLYQGSQAGVIVIDKNEEVQYRNGQFKLPTDTIVGGWAKVYVKGYQVPIESEVSFDEYAGRTKEGKLNGQWSKMPAVMIRKVALCTALREAFPDTLGGLYDSSEMNTDLTETAPVQVDDEPVIIAKEQVEVSDRKPTLAEQLRFSNAEAD